MKPTGSPPARAAWIETKPRRLDTLGLPQVAARADRDEAFQPTLSRREDSCDHGFGAERTLISPTGMDSFVPPSDRMSLRESGKRSPDYRFRAHIYTIRAGYTPFSVTYTQLRSAIHNSLQLYTIRSSYTQFRSAIHNSGQLYTIRAHLYTIPRRSRSTEPVRMRSATPSTGCIRPCDTPVIAPGRVFRRHDTVADESLCKVVSRAAAPRPTEPGQLYTIPASYTQFRAAIHNSFRLYTIRSGYTQFAPAIHNSRRRSWRGAIHPRRVEERLALAPDGRWSKASSRTWIVRVSRPGIRTSSGVAARAGGVG